MPSITDTHLDADLPGRRRSGFCGHRHRDELPRRSIPPGLILAASTSDRRTRAHAITML